MHFTDILKDINYLSYIGAFSKWIIISLLISGTILFICGYFNLFKRNNKLANILTKFYYGIIPIYFFIFAIKIAPIHNTQKELNSVIEENQANLTTYTSNFLNYISSNNTSIDSSSVQGIIKNFIAKNEPKSHDGFKFGKQVLKNIKMKLEEKFLYKITERIIAKKAIDVIGLDKKSSEKIIQLSLNELFNEGEIVGIFQTQVNRIFRGIYKSIFIMFLIGLFIPIIEITLAKTLKY
jgi:hypothetical protein